MSSSRNLFFTLGFYTVFLTFFVQMGRQKPDFGSNNLYLPNLVVATRIFFEKLFRHVMNLTGYWLNMIKGPHQLLLKFTIISVLTYLKAPFILLSQ